MQAVLSATAGLAFLIDGNKFLSMDAGAPENPVRRRAGDFLHLFGDASDLLFLEDVTLEEVRQRLQQLAKEDDALALALICLDSQLAPGVRRESAADLEEMFEAIGDSLANMLFAHSLPEDADLTGALRLAEESNADRLCELLKSVRSRQDAVREVREAWLRLPERLFEKASDRSYARAVLVREGFFRRLVQVRYGEDSLDSFLANALQSESVQNLTNYRELLQGWVQPFEASSTNPKDIFFPRNLSQSNREDATETGSSQIGEVAPHYTDISCPRRVSRQTLEFALVVRLKRKPVPFSAAVEKLKMAAGPLTSDQVKFALGRAVQVNLQAPGFEVLGPASRQIKLDSKQDSAPVVFDLRPLEVGAQRLSLDFYQDGNPLGTVDVPVDVLQESVAQSSPKVLSQEMPTAPDADRPDLVLRIVWDERQASLNFALLSLRGTYWRQFPALPLAQSPSDYAQRLLGDLCKWSEPLAQESAGTAEKAIDRRIRSIGQSLWRDSLPKELKDLYSEQRTKWRNRTILILSDEPYLPWELVWPYGDGWEDDEPWCLNLRLSRWLVRDERGSTTSSPPGHFLLSSLLLLAAADPCLPLVDKERDRLIRLMRSRGVRSLLPDPGSWERVMRKSESENHDWLRIAGHGEFSTSNRPAFVLNACHMAQQESRLTHLDGWVTRLIGMGAGMFLGPQWAITEESALGLTTNLYKALLDGLPLAEALRTARQASRKTGNSAWLAYSLYGHPNARLRVNPAMGQP